MPSRPRLFLGLMSGTSVDAIDAALVEVTGTPPRYRARTLAHREKTWPADLRRRLLAAMAPSRATTQEICQLNALVSYHFADAAVRLLEGAKVSPAAVTAIGSHGQTVCHLPRSGKVQPREKVKGLRLKSTFTSVLLPFTSRSAPPSTLQLGDPSVIATLTGIPTVGNFRPADMAVGGQGAPLVPWTDAILLGHATRTRCVQNIGGIGNVTYLPGGSGQGSVVSGRKKTRSTDHRPLNTEHCPPPHCLTAFDTGPGNMLLDAIVSLATGGEKTFDRDAGLALRGTLDGELLGFLRGHAFFRKLPPKSTGREDFGVPYARTLLARFPLDERQRTLENYLNTVTHLTAWSIADAYKRFLPAAPDDVILCGGGADNPLLTRLLAGALAADFPGIKISRIDEHGIPNKSKEATSFALLAAATWDGQPANLPSVTGARRPVILGVVADPRVGRRRR